MIDDEAEPTEPLPEEEVEDVYVEPRAKSPWKAFVLTGLVASLFGAAGGGYGVYEGVKRISPKAADQATVDIALIIAPLESKLEALSNRLTTAESAVKKAANRAVPETVPVDFSADLSAIEARLNALESVPAPEIDPDALTALQAAQADGFEWPDTSSLEDRLTALETEAEAAAKLAIASDDLAASEAAQVSKSSEITANIMERLDAIEADMKAKPEPATQTKAIDETRLEDLEARLDTLENRPAPAPRVERVSILAFPKTAMIEAVEDSVEGGIMKRALSKHIRVKDDDDPITLIDAIEVDIAQGRLDAAANKFDRLPEPVRAAGQAWYKSVKASL